MARDIVLAIEIHEKPKTVFDTIATRSGLASFWTPDVEGVESVGGELSFGFAEAPVRLLMRVSRLDATSEIEWECLGAFPFWEGTTVSWSLSSSEHGTQVLFRHLGFADEMPEYDFGSIAKTWGSIVARLKEVVESDGAPNPALN
jgi:uncharacterized protein YndB with AHSA1/START domain